MVRIVVMVFLFLSSSIMSLVFADTLSHPSLKVLLDWKPTPSFVGFYVAEKLGFYQQRGLNVKFQHGTGAADAVKLVGSGKYDLGTASAQTMLFGISENIPVKSIAVLYPRSSTVLISMDKSNIFNINDLRGKVIGINRISATFHDFRWIMYSHGLTDGVDYKEVDVGWENAPLLLGQVDAILDYSEQSPVALKSKGIPIKTIRLSDVGLEVYGFNMIGNENFIKRNNGIIRDFVAATIDGYNNVRKNPSLALSIFIKRFPENDQNVTRNAIQEVVRNLGNDGIGCQNSVGWEKTWRTLSETGALPTSSKDVANRAFVHFDEFCK